MSRSTPPGLANRTWRWRRRSRAGRLMIRFLASVLVAIVTVALSANQASGPAAAGDAAAFSTFFHARTAREAADASDQIVASGVGFDEAFARLRQGRVYSRDVPRGVVQGSYRDRKSTRLNSSHVEISYAVFCLKKKKRRRL